MIEKYQREMLNHKGTRMVKNLTQITNDELEKLNLNFTRCANRDVASLTSAHRRG